MKFPSTPTSALVRYAINAEYELAQWESNVAELTKKLATAKRRVKQETRVAAEYRAEIARREAEDD